MSTVTDQSPAQPKKATAPKSAVLVELGGYPVAITRTGVGYSRGMWRARFAVTPEHWLNDAWPSKMLSGLDVLIYPRRALPYLAAKWPGREWFEVEYDFKSEGDAVLALLDLTAKLDG